MRRICISTLINCKFLNANVHSKDTAFEDLEKEDKISLTLVLLKQLQPYLSANNLSIAAPKGFKGGPVGGGKEVEALNKVLNNINVQTKKSELGSAEGGSRTTQLPRKFPVVTP